MITVIASVAVWMIVMGLIILLIFRIFGFYIGTINDALTEVKPGMTVRARRSYLAAPDKPSH